MHNSSSEVKEHLISQINDLERYQTSLHTELLINKQRVQELEQFEAQEMENRAKEKAELKRFKKEVAKEVKVLRKESQHLRIQNQKYEKSLISLKLYMEQAIDGNQSGGNLSDGPADENHS